MAELTVLLPEAGRQLLLAAGAGDRAEFGRRYGRLLDDPDFERVTVALIGLLTLLIADWLPDGCDPATAVRVLHERLADLHPRCTALIGVNLVVLEHLARSVLDLSELLAGLTGAEVSLYAGLIVGTAVPEPARLDELVGRLA